MFERVRDAVERHGSAKVNTAFNGEFMTNIKRDIKSINIKNREIYRYTDLHEWYEQHIIEPTLTSLEEFQERDSVGIVANPQFGSECEQTKSRARGMLLRGAAGNNDETSGDQC